MSAEGQLHNLLAAGLSTVQVPSNLPKCNNPVCDELNRTDFAPQDTVKILKRAPTASALLDSISPLPDFRYSEDLTLEQKKALKAHPDGTVGENSIGFVPQGILDPDRPVVLIRKGLPLYAALVFVSHELQHAADQTSPWAKSIDDSWKQMNANAGVLDPRDHPDPKRMAALKSLFTYISEYRAFSTDSQVQRELNQSNPCFAPLWAYYHQFDPSMTDLDPAMKPSDRSQLLGDYIQPSDYESLKKDLDGFGHSAKLSDAIKQSGIQLKELRDALKSIM